jgi:hypothetical protein
MGRGCALVAELSLKPVYDEAIRMEIGAFPPLQKEMNNDARGRRTLSTRRRTTGVSGGVKLPTPDE